MNDLHCPEGIESRHVHEEAHGSLHGWPGGLTVLGILLAAALVGIFGGETRLTGAGNGLEVVVDGPVRIRNGEVLEMRLMVSTKRDIRDLVLLVDKDIWHNVTVNTFIPAATGEGFRGGAFEFHFGALPAGNSLLVKVDGQINPSHRPARNDGNISFADGETVLATVSYIMDVLP
jgi:hypothetical protein